MFKNMRLGSKIGLGFCALILIAVALGSMATWNMNSVRGNATMLATEYVPEVAVANNVERHSLLTMYNMRGYALSEDAKLWDQASAELETTKKFVADAKALSAKSADLVKLKAAVDVVEGKVGEYEKLAQNTQSIVKAMADDRVKLNDAAQKFVKNVKALEVAQHDLMVQELGGEGAKKPAEAPAAAQAAPATPAPVTAQPCPAGEATLKLLAQGNSRYTAGTLTHPNSDAVRRADTAKNGQHPSATILTCSDSRVPTETIFDQGIGDLFIIRVAGNVCDKDEIGSVEYGLEHIGTPLFIVMGHTKCGAVTAVTSGASLQGSINAVAGKISPALETVKLANPKMAGDDLVSQVVRANVWQTMQDLLTHSPIVRELALSGKVKLAGAVYNIETGQVEWLGSHPRESQLLALKTGEETPGAKEAKTAEAPNLQERLKKIELASDVHDLGNEIRIAMWKAQAERDPKMIDEALKKFVEMDKTFDALTAITRVEQHKIDIANAHAAANEYRAAMTDLKTNWISLETVNANRSVAANGVLEQAQATAEAGIEHTSLIANTASTSLTSASRIMVIGLIAAVVIGIILSVFITRGITGPLNRVIQSMTRGAEQVASASGQVSQSSQQMAEGASEQASSLEEVSSSLEELTSMTKQNSENAKATNAMATGARQAAEKGSTVMERMSDAISKIKTSSDQTAKIVKTIDEIAFQTNLLALNAAVEAARAGEAGKGFAVVAEEVRNLAMRSAEAAKNTASLIEESQKNAEGGVVVSNEVGEILRQIFDAAQKVTQLSAEVSSGSVEQAQGIEQINTAVAEMDKVTQSNAANAEESASASEELSAQARELSDMVSVLVGIVQGSSHGKGQAAVAVASRPNSKFASHPAQAPASAFHPAAHGPQRHEGAKLNGQQANGRKNHHAAPAAARVAKPDVIIPLDDDELNDF